MLRGRYSNGRGGGSGLGPTKIDDQELKTGGKGGRKGHKGRGGG